MSINVPTDLDTLSSSLAFMGKLATFSGSLSSTLSFVPSVLSQIPHYIQGHVLSYAIVLITGWFLSNWINPFFFIIALIEVSNYLGHILSVFFEKCKSNGFGDAINDLLESNLHCFFLIFTFLSLFFIEYFPFPMISWVSWIIFDICYPFAAESCLQNNDYFISFKLLFLSCFKMGQTVLGYVSAYAPI